MTGIAYQNGVTTTNSYNDARAFLMGIATKDASLVNLNSVTYTRPEPSKSGQLLSFRWSLITIWLQGRACRADELFH